MTFVLNTDCANAGCAMTFERLDVCICMGLRKIMRADRNVKVARQSMYGDTAVDGNVTGHILGRCPDERHPTVMPLPPPEPIPPFH